MYHLGENLLDAAIFAWLEDTAKERITAAFGQAQVQLPKPVFTIIKDRESDLFDSLSFATYILPDRTVGNMYADHLEANLY